MKNIKDKTYIKLLIITVLILLLLIPSMMIKDLILEREQVQENAISEVSFKWGEGQTISGPFISIPYDRYIKKFNEKNAIYEIVKVKEWIHFLPENLIINGNISPEKRYRGIFEVVLYESEFEMSGNFKSFNFDQFDIDPKNIHLDKATLHLGISDLKGIENQITLTWNQEKISFNSGTVTNDVIYAGINLNVPIVKDSSRDYSFSTSIKLKGSQYLYFTPVGKTSNINISSNWSTPSFTGTYLPDSRQIDQDGFEANWNIFHLNRNYPQAWLSSQHKVENSSFGINLLLPVDNYKKSYRVAKYSILFLVLTFTTFFFIEVMKNVFIHPIQYLLVGFALIIFYSLLLSFSEHINFNLSYIIASIITLLIITLYVKAITKNKEISIMICLILTLLYSFIFTIIQLEDYALLVGNIGMFIILSIVMYTSSKIDWANIKND